MAGDKVHLNGRIVPAEQATVSVWDAGFLHGASAFTTMLAHNGVVFRLARHLERLMETVRVLDLRTAATSESLRSAVYELLGANGLSEARMRITLTPGSVAQAGSGPDTLEQTTLITADQLPEYPSDWYEKGITVVLSSFRQLAGGPTFGYKTGCYLTRMLARRAAAGKGAEEALWYTADNRLAESCFCNVFLVLDGKVRTPPIDTPVLPGVVRQAVIELCSQLGIDCDDQTPLRVREMLAAEEMFLTASCSGIRPVVRVERHVVGNEKPGEITGRIVAAYQELLDRECRTSEG